MGVHGLTTYLQENKHVLSNNLRLHRVSKEPESPIPLVVDAWSFMFYMLESANIPWVYGGECEEFAQVAKEVVGAWQDVGLAPVFVFDGATPQVKYKTIVERRTRHFNDACLLFFRTSSTSRSTPRFLNETRMHLPLALAALVSALRELEHQVSCHFVEEEGDPYAVDLAGNLGGFVTGLDSDFVVLNSDGYRGYIPLDEIAWIEEPLDPGPNDAGDDDFVVAKSRSKKRSPKSRTGIVPPDNFESLSINVYRPELLAKLLQLPTNLLPLLGAFVGNDYSSFSRQLFRRMSPTERITHTASVLRTFVAPQVPGRRGKSTGPVTSAVELIQKVVSTLLQNTSSSGEVDKITDAIVQSTLQYAVPKAPSSEHWPVIDGSMLGLMPVQTKDQIKIRGLYEQACRTGNLARDILNVLVSGRMWTTIFLENPDAQTTALSIGRDLRLWIYAILEDGVGIPDPRPYEESELSSEPVGEDEGDEDELIDLVEENSEEEEPADPIKALQGALQRLGVDDEVAIEPPRTEPPAITTRPSKPHYVQEFVRKGTRVVSEDVLIPSIHSLLGSTPGSLPLQLQSSDARFACFLNAFASDIDACHNLAPEMIIPVVSVRWVVRKMAERSNPKALWTQSEAVAFLSSCNASEVEITANPPIIDRNIELTSQVIMALHSAEHLVHVLLLHDQLPTAERRFSGKKFHAILTDSIPLPSCPVPDEVWEGLEACFAEPKEKKRKKKAPAKKGLAAATARPKAGPGMFSILSSMED